MCKEEKTEYEYATEKYDIKHKLYQAALVRLKVLLNKTDIENLGVDPAGVAKALDETNIAFKKMEVERYRACHHIWFIDKNDRCVCARCGADTNVLKDQSMLTELDIAKDAECAFFDSIKQEHLPGIEVFINGDLCELQKLFIIASNENPDVSDDELVDIFVKSHIDKEIKVLSDKLMSEDEDDTIASYSKTFKPEQ